MRSDESFDLLGVVTLDAKNRLIRLVKADGVTFRYYIGPDASGFILEDGTGEYLLVGNEKRWWRGVIDSIPDEVELCAIGEFSLLSVKPDAFQRKLDDVIFAELDRFGLSIVRRREILVDRDLLFRLYPYFFESDWEEALVRYFCSSKTLFLLVTGEHAIQKGLELRSNIRARYRNKNDHPVINLIHSPDSREEAYREALLFFQKDDIASAVGL